MYNSGGIVWIDEFNAYDEVAAGVAPVWKTTIAAQSATLADGLEIDDMTEFLQTIGTPTPTITVVSVSPTPEGLYDDAGNAFVFYPDTGDAGKTFTFTFEARNATGWPQKAITVNVAGDYSTANGIGNGAVQVNGTWYYCGNSSMSWCTGGAFENASLGALTALALGGQAQTWNDSSPSTHTADMRWSIYPASGSASDWGTQTLDYLDNNGENGNARYQTGGGSYAAENLNSALANLAAGNYKLAVNFRQQTGADSWNNDNNGNANYKANFSVAAVVTAGSVSGAALTATHPGASSGYQSFTVSGSHLTGALTVTAPSGFAVCSTSGGTYGNTVTLTPSGTTLGSTTVYLKLAANTASGSHSDNVTISGGGLSANVTVAVSGTVVPAALTLGAAQGATPGTVTLTVSGREGDATVNVRRYTTSAAASSDTTGTGGTQVTAVNANGTFTDSGLNGCTTYYYKGWQSKGGQTSAATEVKSAKTALAAPGNVDADYAIVDGEPVITVTWDDAAGASSYLVQVATDDDFTEATAGGSTVLEEHFDKITVTSDQSTDIGTSMNNTTYTEMAGWSGSKVYQAAGSRLKLGAKSTVGELVTPELTVNASGAVSFTVQNYSTDAGDVRVYISTKTGSTWSGFTTQCGSDIVFSSTADDTVSTSVNWTLPSGASAIKLMWTKTSAKRFYIDDIVVSTGGAGTPGSIVSSGTVGSGVGEYSTGSGEVEFDEDYYYRVQAISTGECEEWSDPEGPLTPIEANAAPVWKTIAAVTRTLAAGQMSKDMKAELSTAGIPAPTFSVTMNTGSATPAGAYAVNRDTGVFTYTPALADAGKTFTFKFTASNSEGSPTQTMAVTVTAGSLTLTGSFSTFNAAAGAASMAQSVTLAGSNLGNGETVTVGVGSPFEVSLTGNDNDYAASKTLTATSAGAIAGQLVYVRVAASASPGNNQTGTLSAYCTSAGGSGSAVTKSLTADVSGESTATSIEKSFIVVNNGTSDEWYNGSGTEQTYNFSERYLGEYTSLKLAGEAGTRNDAVAGGHVVTMNYTVDSGTEGAWSTLTMPWKEWDDPLNKHQSHVVVNDVSQLVYTPDLASGRAPGLYYIRVFFSQVTTGGTIYDSRGGLNYVASFRVPLSTPSISSVTTAGAVTLSGGDSGATYVVVRKTSNSGWGTPSGGLPTVGNDNWCGGTVVYVGTAAGFSDTTAAGCATYYYKAWTKSASENVWSAGSAVYGAVTMATPAAPTLNALSDVTFEGLTASWSAVPGAVTYRMDVAKSFGGTVTETFNDADLGTGTVSSYLNRTITDGDMGTWTATECRIDKTNIDGKAPTIGAGGTLVSPPLASGCTAVSFQYAWPFSESGSVTIKLYDDDVEVGSETISTSSGGTATFSDLNIAAGSVVKFSNTGTSNKRMLMDNITFTSTPDYVSGWENVDVSSLMTESAGVVSVDVTGLAEHTTYYVRVKAEGATGSCTSLWSNVESATTPYNDSLTNVGIGDANGTGGTTAVADGHVLASGTALVQGTKLTVASGTTVPTLSAVRFTTTGTATGSDIESYRVKVTQSATWASGDTGLKGTVNTAAGDAAQSTYTVTFGSDQTLTPGQTYYVWIEAVTKAGATGGHTIGVAALGASAFSTTGARMSDSDATTATGTQTIWVAPTASVDPTSDTWAAMAAGSATVSAGAKAYPAATWSASASPAAVNTGSFSGNTFTWTPAGSEIGSTVTWTLTAESDAGSSSCTLAVTVGMVNLTAFSASQVPGHADQLALSWTTAAGGTVLVRWSATSPESIPGPATSWTEGAAWSERTFAAGSTGATLEDLTACKTYYFKAWECKNGLYSATALTDSGAPVSPGAPENPEAVDVTSTTATLTWDEVSGAVDYVVHVWTQSGGSGDSYGGEGTFSLVTSASDFGDGCYVLVPYGGTVAAKPSISSGVLATDAGVTFESGAIVNPEAEYVWIVKGATYGGTTRYSIKNADTGTYLGANSSSSGNLSLNASDGTDGTMWDLCSFSTGAYGSLLRSVTCANGRGIGHNGTSGFKNYAAPASSDYPGVLFYKLTGTKTDVVNEEYPVLAGYHEYNLTGLTQDTNYYWTVKARGYDGCTNASSATATQEFETLESVGAPTGVSATDGAYYDQVVVTWNSRQSEGATGYKVYRGGTAETATLVGTIASGATTTFTDTGATGGLDVGTVYRYWVTSVSSSGESKKREASSDTGFAGLVLRETGFEGWGDGWLVEWEPDATSVLAHRREFEESVAGATGDHALRVDPGETVQMDAVALPDGMTEGTLVMDVGTDDTYAADRLYVKTSVDGGETWRETEVLRGNSGRALDFAEVRVALTAAEIAEGSVLVAFEHRQGTTPAEGETYDGVFFVDNVRLYGDAGLPTVGFGGGDADRVRWVAEPSSGDLTVTFGVVLSAAQSSAVRVEVESGGWATEGSDYDVETATVTIPAGQTTADATLTVNADNVAEGSEPFWVRLKNPHGAKPGARTQQAVVIADNDGFKVVSAKLPAGDARGRQLELLGADVLALQGVESGFALAGYDVEQVGSLAVAARTAGGTSVAEGAALHSSGGMTAEVSLANGATLYLAVVDWEDAGETDIGNQSTAIRSFLTLHNADYVAVAGDLHAVWRTDTQVTTLTGYGLSDEHQPCDRWVWEWPTDSGTWIPVTASEAVDGMSVGNEYDYILENETLALKSQPLDYAWRSYPDGMLFDTRDWGPTHVLPALAGDTMADGNEHRPVVKVYTLAAVVGNPGLTVANDSAAQNTWSVTENGAGDGWVLVRNTTGTFGTPVTGMTPPSATGGDFLGGEVIALGTAGNAGVTTSRADTGLTGCQNYHYKAWSYTAGDYRWSTGIARSVLTAEVSAPTGLTVPAGSVTASGFTAQWNAVAGVDHYEVSVGTEPFGGAATFTKVTSTPASWEGEYIIVGNGTSSAMSATQVDGKYLQKTSVTLQNSDTTVAAASVSDAITWKVTAVTGGYRIYNAAAGMYLNPGTTQGKVSWSSTASGVWEITSSGATVYLHNPDTLWYLELNTGYGFAMYKSTMTKLNFFKKTSGSSALPGWEEVNVAAGTTQLAVTGLEESGVYYWEVRAVGGCESDWSVYAGSGDGKVTLAAGAVISVAPSTWNFGQVEKNDSSEHTFTISNTGHADLHVTGLSVLDTASGEASPHFSVAGPAGNPAPTAGSPLTIAANGGSAQVTVTFAPTAGGNFRTQLAVVSDASGGSDTASLTGSCNDPETEPPTLLAYSVGDGVAVDENTVTDHSLALTDGQPVFRATLWHVSGLTEAGANRPQWRLLAPDGTTAVPARYFDGVDDVVVNNKTRRQFRAVVPNLEAGNAVLGDYHFEVRAVDSTGAYALPWTGQFTPEAASWVHDRFTRADAVGNAVGGGWTVQVSEAAATEAALADESLELYGPHGTAGGSAGRIALTKDAATAAGYPATLTEWDGQASWGFHFTTAGDTTGLGSSQQSGAFVLAANEASPFSGTVDGYAVLVVSNRIELAKFTDGLTANSKVTGLGGASFAYKKGDAVAVRVDYIPGEAAYEDEEGTTHPATSGQFRLYAKSLGTDWAAACGGNPVAECDSDDIVCTVDESALTGTALAYAGMAWNHGSTAPAAGTAGLFDDIYLPHLSGQGEPMPMHVIDEDTEAPVFTACDVAGAYDWTTLHVSGLDFTATVEDASGLDISELTWTAYSNGVQIASGGFDTAMQDDGEGGTEPATDGGATAVSLTATIPAATFNTAAAYNYSGFTVTLGATDYDVDREGDSLSSTATYTFTVCETSPSGPAWATVQADGPEMTVLRWQDSGAPRYMVVRGTKPFAQDATPDQGGTYSLGSTVTPLNGAKVVFFGDAGEPPLPLAGCGWRGVEFNVAEKSTNYYAVYGVSGSAAAGYYFSAPAIPRSHHWTDDHGSQHWATSDGTADGRPIESTATNNAFPCATGIYEPGEGVDSFAYRTDLTDPSDTNPAGKADTFDSEERTATGAGWGGAWSGDTGKWKIHDGNLPVGETDYPTPAGNKLYWVDGSGNDAANAARLTRTLKNAVHGDFYVAGILNFQYPGAGKFLNIALVGDYDDGAGHSYSGIELVSFGKQGDQGTGDKWPQLAKIWVPNTYDGEEHLLALNPGDENLEHAYEMKSEQQTANSCYVVVGQISPTGGVVRMWVYNAGTGTSAANDQIPQFWDGEEPGVEYAVNKAVASWESAAIENVTAVTGIRVQAGSIGEKDEGGGSVGAIGAVYVDELRFASSWTELFLFDSPEVYDFDFATPAGSGRQDGTDDEGHPKWQVSDGALAHGDIGLNATFGLTHRTGISAATFRIVDADDHPLLLRAPSSDEGSGTTAAPSSDPSDAADIVLQGDAGKSYAKWTVTNALGAAIPTNWISLDSNYVVQVTVTSAGGRDATVTSASTTGGSGATDLFFGEYGEGSHWDKYVEIYNGTGRPIDLYNYFIFRPEKNQDWSDYSSLIPDDTAPYARLSATEGACILQTEETIVLLNRVDNLEQDGGTIDDVTYTAGTRLAKMEECLTKAGARWLEMPNSVLDSKGDVPYLLIAASNFDATVRSAVDAASRAKEPVSLNWLDACGLANDLTDGGDGRFIMSRQESAVYLPRSAPLVIEPSEWKYRDWCTNRESHVKWEDCPTYADFLTTAGVYDSNIGLGGDMEFTVYDDDAEAPSLLGGGVRVGTSAGYVESTPGSKSFVAGGWSFTNGVSDPMTIAEYEGLARMWEHGLTTSGKLTWADELAGSPGTAAWTVDNWANVIEAGQNKGQSGVDFNGISQRKYGTLIARCSFVKKGDTTWVGFEMDLPQLTDRTLAFGFSGGSASFDAGYVAWSADGSTWHQPSGWDFTPITGKTTTWNDWSADLDAEEVGLPPTAGHVWFRVYLTRTADGDSTASGAFRMDNIRLEGCPGQIRISDGDLHGNGITFQAQVRDDSGVNAGANGTVVSNDFRSGGGAYGTAYFECGVGTDDAKKRTAAAGTVSVGGSDVACTNFTWTLFDNNGTELSAGTGWPTDKTHTWFTNTQNNAATLQMKVRDADDDRAGDQTELSANFGMLVVYDDDEEAPMLKMKTMKPRLDGAVAEWSFDDTDSLAATRTVTGISAGPLGLRTTNGKVTTPIFAVETMTNNTVSPPTTYEVYPVYHSGWNHDTKYWHATVANSSGSGSITNISFKAKVGSVYAPTSFKVWYAVGGERASETASGEGTLAVNGAWVKEGGEEAGTKIKDWRDYSLNLATPIPVNAGTPVEVQIQGYGGDRKSGVGATWYILDLAFKGTITQAAGDGEEAYTYITDHDLRRSASLPMKGYLWDAGSGLHYQANGANNPRFELKLGETVVDSGDLQFVEAFTESGTAPVAVTPGTATTTENTGKFQQDVAVVADYANMALGEFLGKIRARDADADRTSGGANVDFAELDGDFGFTVVDQDVKGPSAPGTIGGTGIGTGEAPAWGTAAWNNAPWTNNPHFVVTFASPAVDEAPTPEELASESWCEEHGVKSADDQSEVTGIGEYRVSNTAGGFASAPACPAGAPAGVIGNGGFEGNEDGGWEIVKESNKDKITTDRYHEGTGTHSLQLVATASGTPTRYARQVIPVVNTEQNTLHVSGSLWYHKDYGSSIAHFRVAAYTDTTLETLVAERDFTFSDGEEGDWREGTVSDFAIGDGSVNCIVVTLLATGAQTTFDDVSANIAMGEGNTTSAIHFKANEEGQGLGTKYLFAVDADNDRRGDAAIGGSNVFFVAYDCTPPTPVGSVAGVYDTDSDYPVDIDPTTQLEVKWNAANVGPDDPENGNYQSAWGTSKNVLSPWRTYKFYHGTYEPLADEEEWNGLGGSARLSFRTFLETKYVTGGTIAEETIDNKKYPEVTYDSGAYTNWPSVTNGQEIQDPEARAKGNEKYEGLGEVGTGSRRTRLYDLDFDQHYMVVAVGVDKAGNEGPATSGSWMTNNTIKFAITQGLMRAKSAVSPFFKQGTGAGTTPGFAGDIPGVEADDKDVAVLRWNAASPEGYGVRRTYDLISWDAPSFNEATNNQWTKVGDTVQSNWFADAGGLHLTNQMRFYRAAYENRWRRSVTTTNTSGEVSTQAQTPLMSEDVYGMSTVILTEGQNLVSLHGYPWTNTLAGVFGTDTATWPSAISLAAAKEAEGTATRVDVYDSFQIGGSAGALPAETYYFLADAGSSTGVWCGGNNEEDSVRNDLPLFTRAFAITLPSPLPDKYRQLTVTNAAGQELGAMRWMPILRVPTNGPADTAEGTGDVNGHFRVWIRGGTSDVSGGTYNFVNLNLPVWSHPSKMNLIESGFHKSSAAGHSWDADIIYAYDSVKKELILSSGMYCDAAGTWRYLVGNGSAGGKPFPPNAAIIIVTMNPGEESHGGTTGWWWEYDLHKFYDPPTRTGAPAKSAGP